MKKLSWIPAVGTLAWIAWPVCFAAAVGQTGPSPVPALSPAWSATVPLGTSDPQRWIRPKPAFSYDGRCIATAGNGEARVRSNQGRTLWKWKYGAINSFIGAGSIAVSPTCDAIAIGGDSSYKYVWIAEKNGHTTFIPFPSTPFALAFSREGDSIAVGTGGGRLYLFSRDGKERWSTPPYGVGLAFSISFSPDRKFILLDNGGAIVRIDGSTVANFRADSAGITADQQTIVTSWQPPHGPGPGNVSVWDLAGKQLLSYSSDDPAGVITPDGDRIIARLNIDQEPPEGDFYEPRETALRMFSRDGNKVEGFPNLDGRPVAISPDGKTVLLETGSSLDAIDLTGKRLYFIAVSSNMYVIAPDFSAIVVFSWGSDGDLEYFKLP